jgi:hypothetical protein
MLTRYFALFLLSCISVQSSEVSNDTEVVSPLRLLRSQKPLLFRPQTARPVELESKAKAYPKNAAFVLTPKVERINDVRKHTPETQNTFLPRLKQLTRAVNANDVSLVSMSLSNLPQLHNLHLSKQSATLFASMAPIESAQLRLAIARCFKSKERRALLQVLLASKFDFVAVGLGKELKKALKDDRKHTLTTPALKEKYLSYIKESTL